MSDTSFSLAEICARCAVLPAPAWHRIHDLAAPRHAAILVPLIEVDGVSSVVMTRRTAQMEHGGDWVFPGGRRQTEDESSADTARREAGEELGVDPASIDVIGQLATRGPIDTGYLVEVYVGVVTHPLSMRPDRREVAAVRAIDIAALLVDDRSFRADVSVTRADVVSDYPALRHYSIDGDHHLWGMQADILHEFLHHLTAGRHDF